MKVLTSPRCQPRPAAATEPLQHRAVDSDPRPGASSLRSPRGPGRRVPLRLRPDTRRHLPKLRRWTAGRPSMNFLAEARLPGCVLRFGAARTAGEEGARAGGQSRARQGAPRSGRAGDSGRGGTGTRYLPVERGEGVRGGGGGVWRRGQRQQREHRLARGRPARETGEQRGSGRRGRGEQHRGNRDPRAEPEQPGRARHHPDPGRRRRRLCVHGPEERLPPPGLLLLQLPPPPLEPGARLHPTSPRGRRRRGRRAPEMRGRRRRGLRSELTWLHCAAARSAPAPRGELLLLPPAPPPPPDPAPAPVPARLRPSPPAPAPPARSLALARVSSPLRPLDPGGRGGRGWARAEGAPGWAPASAAPLVASGPRGPSAPPGRLWAPHSRASGSRGGGAGARHVPLPGWG